MEVNLSSNPNPTFCYYSLCNKLFLLFWTDILNISKLCGSKLDKTMFYSVAL